MTPSIEIIQHQNQEPYARIELDLPTCVALGVLVGCGTTTLTVESKGALLAMQHIVQFRQTLLALPNPGKHTEALVMLCENMVRLINKDGTQNLG